MQKSSFFKNFAILSIIAAVLTAISTPILQAQVWKVVFNLNLDKNKEQAERLATLASIDLERGEHPDVVLAKIQNMLENTPQSAEHFACIVEEQDVVIAHPKRSNINKDVEGWTIQNDVEIKTYTQSAGEGVEFGGIQTRLDGSQDITYQVPISSKPWSVCVHTKLDLVKQQARMIMQKIALVVLPSVFLIVLISAFLISREKALPG